VTNGKSAGEPALVGIDVGTTGVKAALLDAELGVLSMASRRLRSTHPHPGWVQQDPEAVLESVLEAVAELLDRASGTGPLACGLDHQGESVLAWDAARGKPLSPIVVWQCKRSTSVLDRLTAEGHQDEIEKRSGLPLDPYFSAGKLTWLLENEPAVAAARAGGTLRLGNLDAFICDRLGAGFATDPSTASRTQLHVPGSDGWDDRLCELFGVPRDTLPAVTDTAGELGTLRHPRWPVELELRARLVDQQAALAGTGCHRAGMAKATYGTGVFVLAHAGDTSVQASHGLLPTVAWRISGRTEYALDGGVFAAGELLEWLAGRMGFAPDVASLCTLAREAGEAGGVRVLPAITGLGAPWWQPAARGVIAGLTSGSEPAHVAWAALDAIAWRVADVVEAVRRQAPLETLRVDGGLTNEPLLLSLQADAAGATVERMSADATVTGAALLAGVGAGLFDSVGAAASLLEVAERIEPSRGADWRQREHERWREFVRQASGL
jgi:glycerol kinase